jgi:hypothetical protein
MWRILTGISGGFELERVAEFTGVCSELADCLMTFMVAEQIEKASRP